MFSLPFVERETVESGLHNERSVVSPTCSGLTLTYTDPKQQSDQEIRSKPRNCVEKTTFLTNNVEIQNSKNDSIF